MTFSFLRKLFSGPPAPLPADEAFARLNELAPLLSQEQESAHKQHSFVCREAILNRAERIAGYEFLLHHGLQERISGGAPAVRRAYDDALIRNLVSVQVGSLLGFRLAFVGIASQSFDNPQLAKLPAENTVLMIDVMDEGPLDFERLRQRVDTARQRGFRIGYHQRPGGPDPEIIPLCDFVRISTPTFTGPEITEWIRQVRRLKTQPELSLIAADIESADDLHVCFRAGFDYFHGPFVSCRDQWHPPRGAIERNRIMRLLGQFRQGEENASLAESIRQDAVITYKLLRYINSPANGLTKEITTIDQALLLLGRERFYRWLSLLLFDVQKAGYIERMLTEQALVRASLMEHLGLRLKLAGALPDQLFLAGLFSLLDKLLNREMPEILSSVAMPQAVCDVLLDGRGPLAPFLNLSIACENGQNEEIAQWTKVCQLELDIVNEESLAALLWAAEIARTTE